jgi:hypothetical protein
MFIMRERRRRIDPLTVLPSLAHFLILKSPRHDTSVARHIVMREFVKNDGQDSWEEENAVAEVGRLIDRLTGQGGDE